MESQLPLGFDTPCRCSSCQGCQNCGGPISWERACRNAIYCSEDCLRFHYRGGESLTQTPRAIIGAASELIVCADLLRKGYSVFRSMAPTCACDLATLKDRLLCRIEVKTAYTRPDGKAMHSMGKGQELEHDVLALCFPNEQQRVEYRPNIDEWYYENAFTGAIFPPC